MAKKVGNLEARLGLNKRGYDRGMRQARQQGNAFGGYMKKLGGIVAGFFAFRTLVKGISSLIKKNADFGQSLADLSAITGAVGADLKFYERQARNIGATTTLSASQAVKAFELMGSARPQLLKNKEALADVTKQAVVLAEAAGLELPTATQALAKAMNQFDIPASQAARIINVLAAGSKEGAEAIPGLADAIRWMGTSAHLANISLEESVGMIELLAEKGLSGSESGAQLRNVILKLQSQTDRLNPKVVGLATALKNLADENLSAAELTEMFGLRNQQAAAILVNNIERLEYYTKAVTGTNVAFEQQAKRVDTIKGRWKAFVSAIESGILQGGRFREVIKNWLVQMTAAVPVMMEGFYNIRNAIVSVINYFIDLYNESTAFRYVVLGIGFAFKTVFGFFKLQAKSMIETFKGLGQIIRDVFTGNWDMIKRHANAAGQGIALAWEDYAQQVAENWNKMMDAATSKKHVQLIDIVTYNAPSSAAPKPQEAGGGEKQSVGGYNNIPVPVLGKEVAQLQEKNKALEVTGQKTLEFAKKTDSAKGIVIDAFQGMSNAISDSLGNSEGFLDAFGKFFADFIKGLIIRLIAATIAALALAVVLSLIGGGAPTKILGLAKGSGFGSIFKSGFKSIGGFQSGGVVPPGYPNDSYIARLSSGEHVMTPKQVGNLRGSAPVIISPKVIGIRGREIRILLDRENQIHTNIET